MYMKDPFAFMEYIFEVGFTIFSHMGYQLIWLESSENLSIQNFIRNNVVGTFTVALNCLLKKQQCGIKKVLVRGRRYGKTRVASWKLKSTSSNSRVRVQIHEFRVQNHELQVQIHELRVQNHELQVRLYKFWVPIHESRVQIHTFKNQWINENSSKQP